MGTDSTWRYGAGAEYVHIVQFCVAIVILEVAS
jgi:hypothetical protein